MEDYLIRTISNSGHLRGFACITTNLVREACGKHQTSPTAAAALARSLTGSALLGAMMKPGQYVAAKFEGNGALKKIIVESSGTGQIRGYIANPSAIIPLKDGKIDVPRGIGKAGLLTVSKDIGLKEPYTGTVHLVSGEIGDDIAYYLTESEQIPSAIGVGAFIEPDGEVSVAGGFLIQSLPPSNEGNIESAIEIISGMSSLTELLRSGMTPEQILDKIFSEIPHDMVFRQPLEYKCRCGKKRFEQGLLTLGSEELNSILVEEKEIEVTCEFCRERYQFSEDELRHLCDEAAKKS